MTQLTGKDEAGHICINMVTDCLWTDADMSEVD